MSDNKNKKTSLEEARLNFEEIQKFAEEQASAQLKEQVAKKISDIFNENITITISGDDVEVSKDNEVVSSIEGGQHDKIGTTEMGLDAPIDDHMETPEDHEEFVVSDDEDEIGLDETMEETIHNKNMDEMNNMTMEDAAPMADPTASASAAPAADPMAAPGAAPVDAAATAPAMPDLLSKIDTLINILMQKEGGAAPAGNPAEAGTEQDFEVIDDEAGAPAPGVAPAVPATPMQEEGDIEITDFDGKDKNFIDEMENEMMEIVDEDEMPQAGPPVEETRSLSHTVKRTGNRNLKLTAMEDGKGHHAPVTAIKENKAHQESKLDELIKENKGLKNTVKALQNDRKEFEEAFVELRTQFNEMQTFNSKLALFNKVLMNGGLTTNEKIKICEKFDNAQTYEEAKNIFKSIIKENDIKVVGDGKEKLKGASTNTAKPKSITEPLYESDEARRAKKLAGITKTEEE